MFVCGFVVQLCRNVCVCVFCMNTCVFLSSSYKLLLLFYRFLLLLLLALLLRRLLMEFFAVCIDFVVVFLCSVLEFLFFSVCLFVCLADWLVLCLYNKFYHFKHHSVAVLRGRRAYFYTPLSVEFI